ncbi:MAG: DEAD/DEAH box helicase family protein [Terriglobia bacterium]|nr:DEAD/DEAH box helicase family protein [Terriglobia bacterium]
METTPLDGSEVTGADLWLPGFGPQEDPLLIEKLDSVQGNSPAVLSPAPAEEPKQSRCWELLTPSVFTDLNGEVTKFHANLKAIHLLRELEREGRMPTEAERRTLNRYTGWGGLPSAFNEDQSEPAWVARAQELRELLSETEHTSAKDSTPNAHYTSLGVIQAMWAIVERLGFRGGKILEPAAGVGYFLGGMPAEIARNSEITAVELDQISARMLKALYGAYGMNILQGAFEGTRLPDGFFDLAIGNVPFGNYKVAEMRNVAYQNFLIHDYFFAKALDLVRPGGLLVFITSSGTMDKQDDQVRQYLASRAKLIAAVRLPECTFRAIANTRVTTDIIVLQKPVAGHVLDESWMHVVSIPKDSEIYGEESYSYYQEWRMQSNEYFAKRHPSRVIGKLKLVDNGYDKSVGCVFEGDLEAALAGQVATFPGGVYSPAETVKAAPKRECRSLQTGDERLGFRVIDGKLWESDGKELLLVEASPAKAERIKGLVAIRDAARALIEAQSITESDEGLIPLRERLNETYDAFRSEFGGIHEKKNREAFRQDADWPLLLSLENVDEENGITSKADLFSRRTVGVTRRLERAESASEALFATLAETGRIDEARLGELLEKAGWEVLHELEEIGAVFRDPETGSWETADAYLSGDVKEKLVRAKASGPGYARNVAALEAVIPPDLAPHEIGARIGSTWIPTSDYEAFLKETFGDGGSVGQNTVAFSSLAGAWDVSPCWSAERSVAATQTYGTNRVNALTLFAEALNQQVPTVYDPDPRDRDRRIVNQKETLAAREKQQDLKGRFVEWLWSDDARAQRLVRVYNDGFNNLVERKYDGSHLVLPGFSNCVVLGPHQRNAIWRIVVSGKNTLLAHAVGAGKTFEMICAGMELRRLGKASKPCHVVPNHILEQYTAEFLRAYPGAKVLMASKDDLAGDRRRTLLSRIATGDWDAVIITHSSFERIPMSEAFMKEYIRGEVEKIEDAIRQMRAARRGNRIVKELARAKKQWDAKLQKLSRKDKKDDVLTFEDLGIDALFIDEAHLFKNLWRFSKMNRIAGLPNSNSERAFDLFVKSRYIMEQGANQSGLVFATATPIANSMAEMWVMQRYLQPDTLVSYMVDAFDTWAGNFGESVTALEVAPDGSGYRMHTRFAKFLNLPELMMMFREVADIQTKEMLNLPTPKVHRDTVTAKASDALKTYVKTLVERADKIRSGQVTSREDNMLAVTNDGRKAALDMRLVDFLGRDEPSSKVALCADEVHRIWAETTQSKGTQLVFCDLSTPTDDGRFNVYSDLKRKLVERGVPTAEVAFIHDYESDAAKAKLFKAVRDGRIRVLLGSTGKMGVGTNVQTRLVALHHLDAPWRPADIEQREGRIERQGNMNEAVSIYRYVTEGSFDTYLWQTLETKAKFIAQVMHGDTGLRSAEEVELAALSYAEVKALASGNPMVLEKAGVDAELAKLAVLKSKWDEQQWYNRQEVAALPGRIAWAEEQIAAFGVDIANRQDVSGAQFSMELEGVRFTDRLEAGKVLLKSLRGMKPGSTRTLGQFAGFALTARAAHRRLDGKEVVLHGKLEHSALAFATPERMIEEIELVLAGFEKALERKRGQLAESQRRLVDLKMELGKRFAQADRLTWLRTRQREIEESLGVTRGDMAAADESDLSEAA